MRRERNSCRINLAAAPRPTSSCCQRRVKHDILYVLIVLVQRVMQLLIICLHNACDRRGFKTQFKPEYDVETTTIIILVIIIN